MSWDQNPFDKRRNLIPPTFNQSGTGGNRSFTEATLPEDKKEQKDREARINPKPTAVELPHHLYIPANVQNLDLRKLATVSNGTNKEEFFRFKCPPGATTRFISYAIYNDGDLAGNYKFEPEVSGARVFPYHGDPTDNFRLALGLAPDLGNNSLVPCQLTLMPEQEIIWYVTNLSGVATDMGIRMVGYFDTTQRLVTPRFGG
jgi:hypothetical protein